MLLRMIDVNFTPPMHLLLLSAFCTSSRVHKALACQSTIVSWLAGASWPSQGWGRWHAIGVVGEASGGQRGSRVWDWDIVFARAALMDRFVLRSVFDASCPA